MRPECETCSTPLPPDRLDARICSHECTFCTPCAEQHGACPNCGGILVTRPTRVS
jgi:hypothetical protein